MSQLSREEIFLELGKIVQNFDIYKCADCANAVMEWLKENDIEGKIIKIKTPTRKEQYILSQRLERLGISESITDNGVHYGVEVLGRVFDNLSVEGMIFEEWLADFDCPSHRFIVTILDSLE